MKHISRLLVLLLPFSAAAQPDSAKNQPVVDITSAYKPTIRSAAKINFSASQLRVDTAKNLRTYEVPGQNLYYTYRPISLKPVALDEEYEMDLGNRNFVKAGLGNYSTPYVRAGISHGDGVDFLTNGYLDYTSSNGKIDYQDFSRFRVMAAGSRFFQGYELYGSASFRKENYFLYGYDHDSFPDVKKDDVRNGQQEFRITAGFRNTDPGQDGIRYNPNIYYNGFSIKDKVTESSLMFNLPLDKNFSDNLSARIELQADLTRINQQFYDSSGNRFERAKNNNVLRVSPSVTYRWRPFIFKVGLGPAWDRGDLQWLPDITVDADLFEKFSLQAGWIGRIVQNTTRNITQANPFYDPKNFLPNTKELEFFGGIKGGLGKHFSFSGKASWISYTNLNLFVNDTAATGKGMIISNEQSAGNLRISGSVSYADRDKFSMTGSVILNGYTGINENKRAWHTLPVEVTGSLRWQPIKKLTMKSGIWMFTGSYYQAPDNLKDFKLKSGLDMSIGAEYAVTKKISAWLDINNLFNNKYERWHDFQVYGINLLGGVLIHF